MQAFLKCASLTRVGSQTQLSESLFNRKRIWQTLVANVKTNKSDSFNPRSTPIHRRIVNFGDNAVPKCKPDPAIPAAFRYPAAVSR
jgi:hypothetical protein